MDIQKKIEELGALALKLGFTFRIEVDEKGQWKSVTCHDSWWTNDLYQARPLPRWKGNGIDAAIESLRHFLISWGAERK